MVSCRLGFGEISSKRVVRDTYLLFTTGDGYNLFEKIDQPLSLQYYSVSMFHDLSEVMVKIQHQHDLLLIVNFTHLLNQISKIFRFHMINVVLHQSLNNLLKVEPPAVMC